MGREAEQLFVQNTRLPSGRLHHRSPRPRSFGPSTRAASSSLIGTSEYLSPVETQARRSRSRSTDGEPHQMEPSS